MSESYRVLHEFRFADGEVVRIGDVFQDNDKGSIQDTFRVQTIRRYSRSGVHMLLQIVQRVCDGEVVEPATLAMLWPIVALSPDDDRIVRVVDGGAR
ncbi:hypothetical protein [Nocardia sp. NPDC004722]